MQETPENTVEVTEEVANETTENTVEETMIDEPKVERTPEEQIYHDLQAQRMGKFKIRMSHGDATYFRNLLDKAEYKGPQQAYLLIIAKTELSQVVDGLKEMDKMTRYDVELTSACIESLGFFMNSFKGKGSDSAMKLFTASMLLRPCMGEINALDEKMAEAKKNLEGEDK